MVEKSNNKELIKEVADEIKKEIKEEVEKTEEPKEEAAPVEEPKEEAPTEEKEAKGLSKEQFKEIKDTLVEGFKEKIKEEKPDSKIVKENKEDIKMFSKEIKQMSDAVKESNTMSFKEAARKIWSQKEYDDSLRADMRGYGVVLNPTSFELGFKEETGNYGFLDKTSVKSHRLTVAGDMQVKATLDTTGNTTTYTQAPVEFSDLYVPGLLDTFNNRTDLLDALTKESHIMGTPDYGWRITASQRTGLAVDRDDPSITKSFMDKVKLQTPIKEYRNGISVTDFMITHSRASIGDLFMIEAEKAMLDLRKEINKDLYLEQADGDGDDILGLEAVADSTGNTTLYGYTRSTANRLKTTALAETYTNNATAALTTDQIRTAYRYPWEQGAEYGNLLIVTSPAIRQAVFELLDGQQQLFTQPDFGFSGAIRFDGIPMLVDSDCPSTAAQRQLYVIDLASDVMVFSRPPQLVGLAKVSAATEAYVMTNLAHVYKNPRRIHMIDNIA